MKPQLFYWKAVGGTGLPPSARLYASSLTLERATSIYDSDYQSLYCPTRDRRKQHQSQSDRDSSDPTGSHTQASNTRLSSFGFFNFTLRFRKKS